MKKRDEKNYVKYAESLRKVGLRDGEIQEIVTKLQTEDKCLDMGICPKCGVKIAGIRDKRQHGHSSVQGEWTRYRCFCGYMLDRVEPLS